MISIFEWVKEHKIETAVIVGGTVATVALGAYFKDDVKSILSSQHSPKIINSSNELNISDLSKRIDLIEKKSIIPKKSVLVTSVDLVKWPVQRIVVKIGDTFVTIGVLICMVATPCFFIWRSGQKEMEKEIKKTNEKFREQYEEQKRDCEKNIKDEKKLHEKLNEEIINRETSIKRLEEINKTLKGFDIVFAKDFQEKIISFISNDQSFEHNKEDFLAFMEEETSVILAKQEEYGKNVVITIKDLFSTIVQEEKSFNEAVENVQKTLLQNGLAFENVLETNQQNYNDLVMSTMNISNKFSMQQHKMFIASQDVDSLSLKIKFLRLALQEKIQKNSNNKRLRLFQKK